MDGWDGWRGLLGGEGKKRGGGERGKEGKRQRTDVGDDAARVLGVDALLQDEPGGAPDVHPRGLFVRHVFEGGGEEELQRAVACC